VKGDFKKRINKQKEEDKKRHERTYMVKDIEVIVDINTCKVSTNELRLIINDLLNTTKNEVSDLIKNALTSTLQNLNLNRQIQLRLP
jgi:hypothetical protein